jgi:hypothetical protein
MILVVTLFTPPRDFWVPKLFETRLFHTWSLIALKDSIINEPSNYKVISETIRTKCDQVQNTKSVPEMLEQTEFSPYEKNVLRSYATHSKC